MNLLTQFDAKIIPAARRVFPGLARFALFVVYAWFGALKIFDASPATPLVHALFDQTLASFVSFPTFSILFGLFEVLIGILFIIPRLERLAIALLIPHMVMTAMPLVLLPEYVWTAPLVPSLEGQYIIKNILIIALAVGVVTHLKPQKEEKKYG